MRVSDDMNRIMIRAAIIDTVTGRGPPCDPSILGDQLKMPNLAITNDDFLRYVSGSLRLWLNELKPKEVPVEESDFIEVFFRTLVNGPAEHASEDLGEMRKGFEALMVKMAELMQKQEVEPEKRGLYDGYFQKLVNWSRAHSRAFITTSSGKLGQVSGGVLVGDKIVVVAGSRTPFILREADSTSDDEQLYELIGEGYVHGIEQRRGTEIENHPEQDLILV